MPSEIVIALFVSLARGMLASATAVFRRAFGSSSRTRYLPVSGARRHNSKIAKQESTFDMSASGILGVAAARLFCAWLCIGVVVALSLCWTPRTPAADVPSAHASAQIHATHGIPSQSQHGVCLYGGASQGARTCASGISAIMQPATNPLSLDGARPARLAFAADDAVKTPPGSRLERPPRA